MGKLFAGPWCDVRGIVGNNVGRYVDGENIFSVKPHKSSKPSSQSQINHRTGFGMMMGQVSLFSGAIAIGFKDNKEKLAPGNAALRYNLKHALSGTAPNYSINYAEFSLGRGKLNPVSTPAVVAVTGETATLEFSWLDGGYGLSDATDLIKVYIHTPGIENLVTNGTVVKRSALKIRMIVPFEFIDLPLHCYIMVVSADGKRVSNSRYCGSVTLS
jgi:hypothetical protein